MKFPLIVCAAIINRVYPSSVNSYVRRVCGGENRCIVEENTTLPRDSCCRPCECDKICLEKKTCCEDSSFSVNTTNNITMQKCLPSVISTSFGRNGRYFNRYYVRATCPHGYAYNQIRYKCESVESRDLEDIPFVSSKDGKIIYKNRHCAECHGEEEFITWIMEIDMFCIKEIFWDTDGHYFSANASYIKDTLMNFCSISLKRPAITDIRYTICHDEQNLVSTCEQNNLPPDNIKDEIEELCLNDTAALTFFHNYMPGKGYNNIYCYLCNKQAAVTCDLEGIEKSTGSLVFLLNGGPLMETEMEDDNKGKELCGHAEVFDTFFGKCRHLVCPAFEFPRRGVCTSLVLSRRLNYNFNFQVFQMSQKFWKPDKFRDFLQLFHGSLLRKLGLRRCTACGFIYKEYRQNSTGSFYLQVTVTTTEHCALDLVLSLAASLEKNVRSNQNLTYVIENVEVLIKYIWSDEEYHNLTAGSSTILSRNVIACKAFSPARFQNCPKVTLTVDEYNSFTNKSNIEEYETAQNHNGAFEICYDDYIELVNNLLSNVEEMKPSNTLAVASVVLTLTFL